MMSSTCRRSRPATAMHMVLNLKGIIVDTSDYAARLSGFTDRQGAIGRSVFDDIAARQRRYCTWLQAALQRALREQDVSGSDWRLTVEGWQRVHWRCAPRDRRYIDYQCYLLTEALPYAQWIARLDYDKRCLDLAPLLPGASFDKKDLAILRLILCGVVHKVIAERIGVSISTVEHRLRRISQLLQPLSAAFPGSSTWSVINAAGLDTFVLANHEWLTYPLD